MWILQQLGDYHFIFDVVSGLAVVGSTIAGWLIKSLLQAIRLEQKNAKTELLLQQENVKADLLARQNKVKDEISRQHNELLEGQHALHTEFAEKHGENKQTIAVHQKDDDGRFNAIAEAQTRQNDQLDRIEKAVFRIANGH